MRNKFIIVFSVLIFVAVIFVNKCSFSEEDVSQWQTYRNEEFGFEVKYPSEWGVRSMTDNITGKIVSVILEKAYQAGDTRMSSVAVQFFLLSNQNPNRLSIHKWTANALKKNINADARLMTNVMIGGKSGIGINTVSKNFGEQRKIFTLVNEADILSISYFSQKEFDQIYKTMISTFKFLK